MNRTTVSLLLILLVVAAACSNVESYAGVDLATAAVEPSATPPPTATPDPQAVDLPNLGEKEFSGTVVTFNYPENWISNESGQSFNVFDPGEQYGDLDRPAVGTFIQLTRTQGLDGNENNLATQVMMRFLGMASQRLVRCRVESISTVVTPAPTAASVKATSTASRSINTAAVSRL